MCETLFHRIKMLRAKQKYIEQEVDYKLKLKKTGPGNLSAYYTLFNSGILKLMSYMYNLKLNYTKR